ncbi:uncharacterized LOC102725191 homolog [Sceloporus undulatus]|uniref:uncharacterized LOC102725191 homolog n=1 Tax=Sceloporus undulatus TaxID=8520 RepID=UPI001C4CF8DB|nr:uncharacterized LOC102725191 homolog [Sceloporus undulatus]
MMFPNIHDRNQSKWTFDLKKKFITNLDLALSRDQVHASQLPRIPPEKKCWLKQPPDFSYRLYITPSLIRKPHGQPKELKKQKSKTSTVHDELVGIRSRLFDQVIEPEVQPKIITRFPHVGPYEAQLMFVKMGKFKTTKYQDPRPHDYRQYEQDMPNFVTSYAKDPLNLKLKLQCLSKVHGMHPLTEQKMSPRSKEKIITYKPKELKWDSKLFLPKEPWPAKSGSFTRHKHQQGAHSAFIERVEETLSKLWLKEASQKQAASKREKAAESTCQKRLNVAVSSESYFETEQQINGEKGQQKGRFSQSSYIGQCKWGMPKSASLPAYIKPEPLGFLLPTGIAQSVEELRCK